MDTAKILQEQLKLSSPPQLQKLHGDASNRIYYRTNLDGKSVIIMQLPEGASSISEEISKAPPPSELPFLNVQRYLQQQGLPVAKVTHNFGRILVLEDLGDVTLEKEVKQNAGQQLSWYQKAIDLLIRIQGLKTTGSCIAFQRSFDASLLHWEFDHFLEYGIEVRQGVKMDPEDLKIIKQGMNFITFGLTKLPQVFVHRDFQSRNLMVQGGKLRLIDFQDALLGPSLYDLVALLRDSYVTLPWTLVEQLIDYYLENVGAQYDPVFFKKMFDWMTIQRKLKDAGRFVYIDRVKKNPNFLPYIKPSLRYVREALERQEELRPLFGALKKYVPEFS